LRSVFDVHCWYSITVPAIEDASVVTAESHDKREYFQVLATQTRQARMKLVATHANLVDIQHTAPSSLLLQSVEVWRVDSSSSVTCYFDSDPEFVDVLTLGPLNIITNNLLVWEARASDTDSCIDLVNPVAAKPKAELSDDDCPVLCLLMELNRLRWHPMTELAIHVNDNDKRFDFRNATSKRKYFQVLLKLCDVLSRNDSVRSDQPQSYFDLLLRGESALPCLGDKHYKALLNRDAAQAISSQGPAALLDNPFTRPLANSCAVDFDIEICGASTGVLPRQLDAGEVALEDGKVDATQIEGQTLQSHVAGLVGPRASSGGLDSSSSSSSLASSGDESIEVHALGGDRFEWFQVPSGPRIRLDKYKPKLAAEYKRWVARCEFHGATCNKKRSLAITSTHGRLEPIAFLAAWNEMGATLDAAAHRKRGFQPPLDRVAHWASSLGDAYIKELPPFD
jgi:hypothetical protein